MMLMSAVAKKEKWSGKRVGVFIAALLVCLSVPPLLLAGLDLDLGLDMDASYPTFAEAIADGAVERGWIHDFVPVSATDIQESHNLDSNRQWLTFRFDAADLSTILERLEPAEMTEIQFLGRFYGFGRQWWPDDLRSPSIEGPNSKVRLLRVRIRSQSQRIDRFAAIEKDAPRLWYWDLGV